VAQRRRSCGENEALMAELSPHDIWMSEKRHLTTAPWATSGGASSAPAALLEWRGTDVARVPAFDLIAVEPLADRFAELAASWQRETTLEPFIGRKVMHPAYQRIIGLGPAVVPLILRELTKEPGHWFWALTALTGQDPAAETQTFAEATRAWLAWGRERGCSDLRRPTGRRAGGPLAGRPATA
jgi:hypothetical protein